MVSGNVEMAQKWTTYWVIGPHSNLTRTVSWRPSGIPYTPGEGWSDGRMRQRLPVFGRSGEFVMLASARVRLTVSSADVQPVVRGQSLQWLDPRPHRTAIKLAVVLI